MTYNLLSFLDTGAQTDSRTDHLVSVATCLADLLRRGANVRRQDLTRLMTEAFGVSDADAGWAMRDAYDALEAAQVLLLRERASATGLDIDGDDAFVAIRCFEKALPTQTYRSERQVDLQQFSTTISLAWLAAMAARLQVGDHVLEPSAGTGMLAVHALRVGARLTLNERDPGRAALLAKLLGLPVATHDAEFIHDHLPASAVPSVVLINPPFSRSEGRGRDRFAGARHLRSALLRLAGGGRCVAIMSPSFAADGSAASAYASVSEVAIPRVEITILGNPYAKHGTSIAVRLLVFDKGWTGQTECHCCATIDAAAAIVAAVPPRLTLPDHEPPRTAAIVPMRPRRPTPTSPSGVFGSLHKRELTAPDRIAATDGAIEPLAYTVRDIPLPPGDPVGHYAPWRLSRIEIAGAKPHPDQLVESVAMASELPPAPSYRPMLQARALAALSEAQLETIIHAGEACERDLPGTFIPNQAGDQLLANAEGSIYRAGYFIADGTGVGKGREGAGCILDQWNCGKRRHVWISRGSALILSRLCESVLARAPPIRCGAIFSASRCRALNHIPDPA